MWTRRELKEKAKFSFKANYWKAVLVAFIAIALGGGMGGAGTAASSVSSNMTASPHVQTASYDSDYHYDYDDELDSIPNLDGEWTDEEVNELVRDVQHETSSPVFVAGAGMAVAVFILIILYLQPADMIAEASVPFANVFRAVTARFSTAGGIAAAVAAAAGYLCLFLYNRGKKNDNDNPEIAQ